MKTLKNIGPALQSQLKQIGISTQQKLLQTGANQAWLKIQQIDESACGGRLYALEGAVRGITAIVYRKK